MASDDEETEAERVDADVGEPYDLLDDGVKDATLMMAANVSDDLSDEGGKQKVTVVDLMMYQRSGQLMLWSLELSKALSRKACPTVSESVLHYGEMMVITQQVDDTG